jgi:hypothetical protein
LSRRAGRRALSVRSPPPREDLRALPLIEHLCGGPALLPRSVAHGSTSLYIYEYSAGAKPCLHQRRQLCASIGSTTRDP